MQMDIIIIECKLNIAKLFSFFHIIKVKSKREDYNIVVYVEYGEHTQSM